MESIIVPGSKSAPANEAQVESTNSSVSSSESGSDQLQTAATSVDTLDNPEQPEKSSEVVQKVPEANGVPEEDLTDSSKAPKEVGTLEEEKAGSVHSGKPPQDEGIVESGSDSGTDSDNTSVYGPLRHSRGPAFTRRIRNAPRQLEEFIQYSRLMEERMQALEREIRALKAPRPPVVDSDGSSERGEKEKEKEEDAENLLAGVRIPTLMPEIRRLAWSEFSTRDFKETCSVDVLYGEPEETVEARKKISQTKAAGGQNEKSSVAKSGDASAKNEPELSHLHENVDPKSSAESTSRSIPTSSYNKDDRPTRIRLVSRLLRIELRELTGYNIVSDTREILEPFAPFIRFEAEIRAHDTVLRERLSTLREEEAEMIRKMETKENVEKENVVIPDQEFKDTVEKEKTVEEVAAQDRTATSLLEDGKEDSDADSKQLILAKKKPTIMFPIETVEFPKAPENVLSSGNNNALDIAYLMIRYNLSQERVMAIAKGREMDEAEVEAERQSDFSSEETVAYERRMDIFQALVLLEEWKLLITLLDQDLAHSLKIRNDAKSGCLDELSFHDMCSVFEPGQIVMAQGDNRQALQIFAVTGGRRRLDEDTKETTEKGGDEVKQQKVPHIGDAYNPLIVDCYHYDYDGQNLGAVQKSFIIKWFKGKEKVKSLPLYPGNFASANVREDLMRRGEKFMSLCCPPSGIVHRQYVGLSFDEPSEEIDSPVIIDVAMASRVPKEQRPEPHGWVPKLGIQGPAAVDEREVKELSKATCGVKDCKAANCGAGNISPVLDDHDEAQRLTKEFLSSSEILSERTLRRETLKPEDYMLFPCRVFGFVLRSRRWARLDIDNVDEIKKEERNFDKLVLPDGYKDIVQALVETHFKKQSHNADLVRGKGKGLIILLHGAPGVGKTSTAETVAEHTGKPLFSITCGDIGETAAEVEENLDKCFQMAHKWGCVLLLDEADVFLAKRTKDDLKRNALVSVFLRVLEYYAGILFLTTNRVGVLDEAFKSRIHMSLGYPALDLNSTREIWKMNLERTKDHFGKQLKVRDSEIIRFAERHFEDKTRKREGPWNGRQIRNAFQTAIALAQWDVKDKPKKRITLDSDQFERVADASSKFDSYLIDMYSANDDERASVAHERRNDSLYQTPSGSSRSAPTRPDYDSRTSSQSTRRSRPPVLASTPSRDRNPQPIFEPAEATGSNSDSEDSSSDLE